MVISFGGSGIGFGCVWKVSWNYLLNAVFHATVCKMFYVQNLYFTLRKSDDKMMSTARTNQFFNQPVLLTIGCSWDMIESIITKVASKIARRKKLAPRQESAVKTDYLEFTVQSLAYLRLGFKAKMNAVWSQTKEDITPAINPTWHWKVTFFYRR